LSVYGKTVLVLCNEDCGMMQEADSNWRWSEVLGSAGRCSFRRTIRLLWL